MEKNNLPAVIQDAIVAQKINTANVNLLLPTQTFGEVVGKYDKVSLEVINININPDAGEVFPIGGKKAFTKIPLQKISNALGIAWDPERTCIIESSSRKSRAKASGAMRKPNGEYIYLSEEKTVDLEAIEEEILLKLESKTEKGNPDKIKSWGKTATGKSYPVLEPWQSEEQKQTWLNLELRKSMLQYRKFKDERAMTGAKNRVIRALIAIKSSYTDEELSKPFVFPKITVNMDKLLESPETRSDVIQRMTGPITNIFGPGYAANNTNQISNGKLIPESTETIASDIEIVEDEPINDEKPGIDELSYDDIPFELSPDEEITIKRDKLIEYSKDNRLSGTPVNLINNLLQNESATLEAIDDMIKRVETFLQKKIDQAKKELRTTK